MSRDPSQTTLGISPAGSRFQLTPANRLKVASSLDGPESQRIHPSLFPPSLHFPARLFCHVACFVNCYTNPRQLAQVLHATFHKKKFMHHRCCKSTAATLAENLSPLMTLITLISADFFSASTTEDTEARRGANHKGHEVTGKLPAFFIDRFSRSRAIPAGPQFRPVLPGWGRIPLRSRAIPAISLVGVHSRLTCFLCLRVSAPPW